MKKYTTGICAHCGADIGIHKFETEHCPVNGKEEARFDRLGGKYFPQQWQETKFEDSGIKKLNDAAPELLSVVIELQKRFNQNGNMTGDLWEMCENAIQKATK